MARSVVTMDAEELAELVEMVLNVMKIQVSV
jgi:hypothetical protein